ncbi:MAG: hypothetical protein IJX71_04195 [Oscillospiraceae bacterium]|nr:hypothetical protein [Oscillospiraceae bacterium]
MKRKTNTWLVLLAALLCLAGLSLLPELIGSRQDQALLGSSTFQTDHLTALELADDASEYLERLEWLGEGTYHTLELPPYEMTLTEEEAVTLAFQALKALQARQGRETVLELVYAAPRLYFGQENQWSFQCWGVTFNDERGFYYTVVIDDVSGCLLELAGSWELGEPVKGDNNPENASQLADEIAAFYGAELAEGVTGRAVDQDEFVLNQIGEIQHDAMYPCWDYELQVDNEVIPFFVYTGAYDYVARLRPWEKENVSDSALREMAKKSETQAAE